MSTHDLFGNGSSSTGPGSSARSLCEKYRPNRIADFVGLDDAKIMLRKFAAHPYRIAWLFSGPTGIGKTSMALAMASEVAAEVHHLVPTATSEDIEHVWTVCQRFPAPGYKRHLILVDDIDGVSKRAQTTLLAKLDARDNATDIIWVFTCPSTEKLDRRFLSFCVKIKFSSYGVANEATALLNHVWELERTQADATPPNFARIVKDSNNDIRAALNTLETMLMSDEGNERIPED